ncbi:hypothetical protein DXG03_009237 [Asterophora parasitica]|uniref:DHHA2 domain-containing protein n=1 Tax=Asterophora parasitica TaxID=117018 RepID=A0A9P7GBJ3_9AGAR|nr:hypothetical protein DXG03_009237 [Asterophora parasitica]
MPPRNPIRRFSNLVSLKLSASKPIEQPAPSAEGTRTLAQFLSTSREKYLNDIRAEPHKGAEWTVVMGNEAGDLDSLASSVAFAWLQSEIYKKPTIPLLQLERDDIDLRAENIHALHLAGITKPKEELLYLTDVKGFSPFPSQNFALVDHNRLGALYTAANPSAKIIAVLDHHEDEGLYKDTASPRTIEPSGSCASHVAALCPPELPADLATLLLTAILIDTNGLKPGGKALATDIYAAGFLASRSTFASKLPGKLVTALLDDPKAGPGPNALYEASAIRELTATLVAKKGGVSHLSGRDLLRRDYKDYQYVVDGKTVRAGLASVPVPLKAWGKGGKFEEAAVAWMRERELVVLGVLTSFRDSDTFGGSGKGKHRREQAWLVYDAPAEGKEKAADGEAVNVEKLAARLWNGLEDNVELKLKKHKKFDFEKGDNLPSGAKGRGYNQKNVNATRKVTAPVLKNIFEVPEPAATPEKN